MPLFLRQDDSRPPHVNGLRRKALLQRKKLRSSGVKTSAVAPTLMKWYQHMSMMADQGG
ncbi:MAG: hypothetical protein HQL51_02920 [Magnetococcales bacterium]|nr:hypothetical protein [Magnetococcales bacterium]